jgi:hypothetical protein
MKIQKTWPLLLVSIFLAAPAAVQAQVYCKYTTNGSVVTLYKYTNHVGAGAVTVSNFVDAIASDAFLSATYVTGITLPSSVTNIGSYAFSGCTGLTSASIAGSANIGLQAFYNDSALTSLTLTAVTNIGGYAFENCSSLTTVTLPSTLASLGASNENAFDGCADLTAINVAAGNPYFTSSNGVVFNSNLTTLIEFPCGLGGTYRIPSTVTTIASEAFGQNFVVTNITIPNSVTNIQNIAFDNCTSLLKANFMGNAPVNDGSIFTGDSLTVYYMTNASGWSNPWDGQVALPWNMTLKLNALKFPTQTNWIGFTITGPTNFNAVVQVCTNLHTQVWTPISTNLLTNAPTATNGTGYFSELGKTNVYWAGRFYSVYPQ